MKRILSIGFVAVLCLSACGQAEEPEVAPAVDESVDEAAAVRAVAESWDSFANAEDVDGLMGIFSPDPIRLNAGEPALVGADACRADFEADWAASDSEGYNPIDDVQVAGNWAFARGTFTDKTTSEETGEVTEETGKWLSILRKTPDGWKFYIDAWNRDAPSDATASAEKTDRGELPPEFSPSDAAEEALFTQGSAWDEANNAEDAEALVGLYTADAIYMAADEPLIQGADALRTAFEEGYAAEKPNGAGVMRGAEIEGDWAYAWGTWTASPTVKETGETRNESGKWLSILRNSAEGWKNYVDIWNRDN